ncbi:MAG: S26 family signal peptidase [Candidatus Methylumidiphilus sp.]
MEKLNLTRCLLTATLAAFATTAVAGLLGARVNTTGSYPPRPVLDDRRGGTQRRTGHRLPARCGGGCRGVPARLHRCRVLPRRLRPCHQKSRGATRRPSSHYREAACTLGAAQVLLMSDYNPKSFDGRYFGPVEQTGIKGVLRPVFTFGFIGKGSG